MPNEKGKDADPKKQTSIFSLSKDSPSEAGRDPIRLMIEITENDKLTADDKAALVQFTRERFKNRRRMAYVSLYTIIASAALLFIGAFIDGLSTCPAGMTCKGILDTVKENNSLFIWINGFLTAIVGAYYGVSAWRPSS